jgi:hypothetical protein
VIDEAGLRIRNGTNADIRIPREAVATVAARRRAVDTRKHVHLDRGEAGTTADVPILKTTTVEVILARPTRVDLPGGAEEIVAVRFHADDPRGFVRAARERLAARTEAEPPYLRR